MNLKKLKDLFVIEYFRKKKNLSVFKNDFSVAQEPFWKKTTKTRKTGFFAEKGYFSHFVAQITLFELPALRKHGFLA